MNAKHTPGPWRVEGETTCEGMGALAVLSPDNLRAEGYFIVAGVVDIDTQVWPGAGDCHANARLIAAAPDLLALVIEAERLYSNYALLAQPVEGCDVGRWINSVRAAIAKATEATAAR